MPPEDLPQRVREGLRVDGRRVDANTGRLLHDDLLGRRRVSVGEPSNVVGGKPLAVREARVEDGTPGPLREELEGVATGA
jgi:hypothetical protein